MKSSSDARSTLESQLCCRIIHASSVGRVAYSRLRGEGIILEVFESAMNILFDDGLVSLVLETGEKGPLNLNLKLPSEISSLFSLGVKAGERVRSQDFALELGDRYLVTFASAHIYSPKKRFRRNMRANQEIETNLRAMIETTLTFGKMNGLGELLAQIAPRNGEATHKKLCIFSSFAVPRIIELEHAFRSRQKNALENAVKELIGLGPGLTPSSDDMLAGFVLLCLLYAGNTKRRRHVSQITAQAIAKEVQGRTTLLSEELLKQAASGRGNESIMTLCKALLTGKPNSVKKATRRLLQIGETSGTDTVLGIALGASVCICKHSIINKRNSE